MLAEEQLDGNTKREKLSIPTQLQQVMRLLSTESNGSLASSSSLSRNLIDILKLAPFFRRFDSWKSRALYGSATGERETADWTPKAENCTPVLNLVSFPEDDASSPVYAPPSPLATTASPPSSPPFSPAPLPSPDPEDLGGDCEAAATAQAPPATEVDDLPFQLPPASGHQDATPNPPSQHQHPADLEELPFQLPGLATQNRFESLTVERDEEEDDLTPASPTVATPPSPQQQPPQQPPPPRPVAQARKRANRQAYENIPTPNEPEPDLSDTMRKAAQGTLFKHRARVKSVLAEWADAVATVDDGAECNVIDAEFFASWADSLQLPLEEASTTAGIRLANNAIQRLVGFTSVRIQLGLSEEMVRFRILDSGGAFQILLGKPWKAQVAAIHFYEVDCIMHKTSIPGRWGRLWNQNPKAAPTFTSVPPDPASLARLLELESLSGADSALAQPAVLLLAEERRREEQRPFTLLQTAARTPLPDDRPLVHEERVLLLPSGSTSAPDTPHALAALLRREAWRRELTLFPRTDICPESVGSAFLSENEIAQVLDRLDADQALEDFWTLSLDQIPEWNPQLPKIPTAWLEQPPPSPVAEPTPNLVMTAAVKPSEEERRTEIRKVMQLGSVLSEEEKEQVYALLDEFAPQFAFSLAEVQATDTVTMHIPTPNAVPTRARHRPTNVPEQKEFLHEEVERLLEAGILVKVHYDDVTWVSHSKVVPKKDLSVVPKSPEQLVEILNRAAEASSAEVQGWAEQRTDEYPQEAAKKKKWRLCHAFLDLNDATVGASWPTGDLNAKIGRLAGKRFYSCFDMHSGYFAIPIAPDDVLKTTFSVEDRGYFAYKRMPFGLKGAPAAFCQLVSTAFQDELGKTMEAWMDDLATSADTFSEHLEQIRRILEICRKHRLSLNPAKCHLFADSMVWCGSMVSKAGVQPDKAKVQAVVEWPTPQNPHEVLQFINFAGHYRKLIKNFAQRVAPLQALVQGVKVCDLPKTAWGAPRRGAYRDALKVRPPSWAWNEQTQEAFDDIRRTLTTFPVVRTPDWSRPFIVETDASVEGFGAVLAQRFSYPHPESGKLVEEVHPVEYISRNTKASEKRYSAFLLELVAVKWALEKFKPYVFGRPIELVSDCQALAGILSLQSVSPAHARWREYILGHDIVKFTHRPGRANAAADGLSRRAALAGADLDNEMVQPDCTIPDTWEQYKERQSERGQAAGSRKSKQDLGLTESETQFAAFFLETDDAEKAARERYKDDPAFAPLVEFLLTLQTANASPAEAGRLRRQARAYFLASDGSLRRRCNENGVGRECIPSRERKALLLAAHGELAHGGRDRLLAHLYDRFYWPDMAGSIAAVIAECPQCQKFGRSVFRSKLQPISILAPMQLLSMDYFSLPKMSGFKTVLVVVDYFSRYMWTYKYDGDGTGAKTVKGLRDLFSRFGRPQVLMSDNGCHFNCQEVKDFCAEQGVSFRTTPTYSPNTNGLVERTNGLLLRALERECAATSLSDSRPRAWPAVLQSVVDRLNDRVVGTTGHRPAELIFAYRRWKPSTSLASDEVLQEALAASVDRRVEALVHIAEAEGRAESAFETLLRNQGIRKERADAKNALARRGVPAVVLEDLKRGDFVLLHASWLTMQLNHKLQQEWVGPYRIVARSSDANPDLSLEDPHAANVTYWLDDPVSGKPLGSRVHANRLKKAAIPDADELSRHHPLPSMESFFASMREAVSPASCEPAATAEDESEQQWEEAVPPLQEVEVGELAVCAVSLPLISGLPHATAMQQAHLHPRTANELMCDSTPAQASPASVTTGHPEGPTSTPANSVYTSLISTKTPANAPNGVEQKTEQTVSQAVVQTEELWDNPANQRERREASKEGGNTADATALARSTAAPTAPHTSQPRPPPPRPPKSPLRAIMPKQTTFHLIDRHLPLPMPLLQYSSPLAVRTSTLLPTELNLPSAGIPVSFRTKIGSTIPKASTIMRNSLVIPKSLLERMSYALDQIQCGLEVYVAPTPTPPLANTFEVWKAEIVLCFCNSTSDPVRGSGLTHEDALARAAAAAHSTAWRTILNIAVRDPLACYDPHFWALVPQLLEPEAGRNDIGVASLPGSDVVARSPLGVLELTMANCIKTLRHLEWCADKRYRALAQARTATLTWLHGAQRLQPPEAPGLRDLYQTFLKTVETELPEDMEERREAGIRHAEAILADCVKQVKEERAFLARIRADYERRKAKTQAWQDTREPELQYSAAFAMQVEAWEQAHNMSAKQYDPERNKDIEHPPVYAWSGDSIPRPSEEEIARDFLPDLEWNTKIAHKFPLLDAELKKHEGWGAREHSSFDEVWPSFQAAWNGEERWIFPPGAAKEQATPFSSTAPLDWREAFATSPPQEMEHTPAWLHTKDWAGLVTEITALAEMGVSPFGAAMTAALAYQQSSYSEFHPDILNTGALRAREELMDKITNPNAPVNLLSFSTLDQVDSRAGPAPRNSERNERSNGRGAPYTRTRREHNDHHDRSYATEYPRGQPTRYHH